MSAGITIELPWPPRELSPNARTHWGRKSKIAKSYRFACGTLTKAAGFKAPEGKLYFWVTFCPPNRRSRDDDNLLASFKSGRDGVADGLGIDDKNFVTTIDIGDPVPGGMVRVHIREYPIKEQA